MREHVCGVDTFTVHRQYKMSPRALGMSRKAVRRAQALLHIQLDLSPVPGFDRLPSCALTRCCSLIMLISPETAQRNRFARLGKESVNPSLHHAA